jgi:hypothetical protein
LFAYQTIALVNSSFKLDSNSSFGLKIIQRRDVLLKAGFHSQSGAHGCVQQGLLDGMLVAVKAPLQCSLDGAKVAASYICDVLLRKRA